MSHSWATVEQGRHPFLKHMLYNTKATTRLGRVDDGNTVSDYEPEEVKRRGSIQTALVPCAWNGHKVNLLDTPGYDDFIGEVIPALRVAEGAVIVVAAPSGVEVGTERSWSMCEEQQLPRMFFINKMDRENADYHRSLKSIHDILWKKMRPHFRYQSARSRDFKGIVDLLRPPDQVPDEVGEAVRDARERLIEAVAETDDDLADQVPGWGGDYPRGDHLGRHERPFVIG